MAIDFNLLKNRPPDKHTILKRSWTDASGKQNTEYLVNEYDPTFWNCYKWSNDKSKASTYINKHCAEFVMKIWIEKTLPFYKYEVEEIE